MKAEASKEVPDADTIIKVDSFDDDLAIDTVNNGINSLTNIATTGIIYEFLSVGKNCARLEVNLLQ